MERRLTRTSFLNEDDKDVIHDKILEKYRKKIEIILQILSEKHELSKALIQRFYGNKNDCS